MDKIDIHLFLNDMNTKERTIILLDVVNELVEGYNEIMKETDKDRRIMDNRCNDYLSLLRRVEEHIIENDKDRFDWKDTREKEDK